MDEQTTDQQMAGMTLTVMTQLSLILMRMKEDHCLLQSYPEAQGVMCPREPGRSTDACARAQGSLC